MTPCFLRDCRPERLFMANRRVKGIGNINLVMGVLRTRVRLKGGSNS